jgi:formamidopyrimidine-DNA glycosylase
MPELPEVETMGRQLRRKLQGRTVTAVLVEDAFLLKDVAPREYRAAIEGRSIAQVLRRGKWLIWSHKGGLCTLIQPRMTGSFRVGINQPPPYGRLCWMLDQSPKHVWYCDTRRLGEVRLVKAEELERFLAARLGPDALEIDARTLLEKLRSSRAAIKAALMDQRRLAGLGNIYAEEALYRAGIHPARPANSLEPAEVRRLLRAIHQVLQLALKHRGTSIRDYRTADGREGNFQGFLRVYGREKRPCLRCGQTVCQIRVPGLSQRSTRFCPGCQH